MKRTALAGLLLIAGLSACGQGVEEIQSTLDTIPEETIPVVIEPVPPTLESTTTTTSPPTETAPPPQPDITIMQPLPTTTTTTAAPQPEPIIIRVPVPSVTWRAGNPDDPGHCDPNYADCVPIANDVDCIDEGDDGPVYFRGPVDVIGTDVYFLDSDYNGIGCE